MSKNLVIVESPAKAKTMEGYLGTDFSVKSSYGHVRDLKKKGLSVDVENGFEPTYEVMEDKADLVRELKKHVRSAEMVWLATDEDREGESISWHLQQALELAPEKVRRVVFREITKTAILRAFDEPRTIDQKLVNAQQARRVLDRLVGFELSPVLWKKIKRGLSAGRVQSAAVRMVVERERDILSFDPESFFKVAALFCLEDGRTFTAEHPRRLKSEEGARTWLEQCVGAVFTVGNLERKPAKKSPAAPFTTSTLQQEASRKLGFSVSKTMVLAQKLYEAGHITYMRTDSLVLSEDALSSAAGRIGERYGEEYVQTRRYRTKDASAQEAHEAIRPSDFGIDEAGKGRDEKRLYQLIWKRAIASQMADARLEKTVATIAVSGVEQTLVARGEMIAFDGFLKVYEVSSDDNGNSEEQKGMLPPLTVGQQLDLSRMTATERFTRAQPRYTEASLVKAMEEKGIGRPSTYAPTLTTIQQRGYVVKESRDGRERVYRELELCQDVISEAELSEVTGTEKMKLFPTDMAMIVNDFLVANFPKVIDLSFTATVEKEFDSIAAGETSWNEMIANFYSEFHPRVLATEENVDRAEASPVRELGTDPKTGRRIVARMARYGPVVELVSEDEEVKPKFAKLGQGQLLENVTLEQALNLFLLPREVGSFEDKPMVAAIGRFGPYIRHDGKFVSLGKEHDPYTVDQPAAIMLIEAKREADAKKLIKQFEENPDVRVLNGRWGPYISFEKKNVRIPKDEEPENLTYQRCVELAAATPEKKKKTTRRVAGAKKKKKKTAAKKKKAKKVTTKKAVKKSAEKKPE
jgi:DNA topoisomerase-1